MTIINRSLETGHPKVSAGGAVQGMSVPEVSVGGSTTSLRHNQQETGESLPYGGMAAGHLFSEHQLVESVGGGKDDSPLLGVAAHQVLNASSSNSIIPSRRDSLISASMLGGMHEDDNDDSEDDAPRGEKRAGRRKIRIEYIEDKSRRHITFSKRKAGIMKKAYELSTLTGTQVLLLVASETGHVYTFATPKLQPLITKPEGKNLIQACLNAPDIPSAEYASQNMGNYENIDDNGKENAYEDRSGTTSQTGGSGGGGGGGSIPVNYAAAMAGLAGFQYPGGQSNAAASAAFLNPAHYPAYAAAQYNAALAAGYWPGAGGQAGPNTTGGGGGGQNSGNVIDRGGPLAPNSAATAPTTITSTNTATNQYSPSQKNISASAKIQQ